MMTRRTLLTGVAAMAAAWALPEWEPRRRVWALGWNPAPLAIMYSGRGLQWSATWTEWMRDAKSLTVHDVAEWLTPEQMHAVVATYLRYHPLPADYRALTWPTPVTQSGLVL